MGLAANDSMTFVGNVAASVEAGVGTNLSAVLCRLIMLANLGAGFAALSDPAYYQSFNTSAHVAYIDNSMQSLPLLAQFQGIAARCVSEMVYADKGIYYAQVPPDDTRTH